MENVLNVSNLTIKLDQQVIVENLSFTINKKDVLVILGPNGAGKTTLLRALLNIIPYTGHIAWNTKKISYLPPQEFLYRRNLPPLSIEEFFKFKKVSTEQIIEIFIEVGLDPEILSRQFGALSTGQFQRMLIAWALIDNPEVLLFDEPTSGIDLGGEDSIYTLLHKFWNKKNLTIVLVTHDLNIVWEHASQVLCLNKNKLCLGKPNEVLTPEALKELYGSGLKYYTHHHREEPS